MGPWPRPQESEGLGWLRTGPRWGEAAQAALGADPCAQPRPNLRGRSHTQSWALATDGHKRLQRAGVSWPHPEDLTLPGAPAQARWAACPAGLTPTLSHPQPSEGTRGHPCPSQLLRGGAGGREGGRQLLPDLRELRTTLSQRPTFLSARKLDSRPRVPNLDTPAPGTPGPPQPQGREGRSGAARLRPGTRAWEARAGVLPGGSALPPGSPQHSKSPGPAAGRRVSHRFWEGSLEGPTGSAQHLPLLQSRARGQGSS